MGQNEILVPDVRRLISGFHLHPNYRKIAGHEPCATYKSWLTPESRIMARFAKSINHDEDSVDRARGVVILSRMDENFELGVAKIWPKFDLYGNLVGLQEQGMHVWLDAPGSDIFAIYQPLLKYPHLASLSQISQNTIPLTGVNYIKASRELDRKNYPQTLDWILVTLSLLTGKSYPKNSPRYEVTPDYVATLPPLTARLLRKSPLSPLSD